MKETQPPIDLAIVGAGRFAERRILPAIGECPGVGLAAVVGRPGRSIPWMPANVVRYESLEGFLAASPGGAVWIATPNGVHASQAIACLEAGLHVLCEKPMAVRASECETMIAASRATGRRLQVGHMLRHSPAIELARRWLADGRIGEPVSASAGFHFDVPKGQRSWASTPALAGGGVLLDAGVHCLDTLRWLLPGSTAVVSCEVDAAKPAMLEEVAVCRVRIGEVACTVDVRSGRDYATRLEIVGSHGRIVAEGFAATWGSVEVSCHDARAGTERQMVDVSHTYARQLCDFADRVTHEPSDMTSALEAAETVAVVEGLYAISRELS